MSMNRFSKAVLFCTAGAAALTAPFTAAQAQDAVEAGGAAEPNSTAEADENVIFVFARKRDERLQDAPVVISALSEKTLEDFAIESVEDISDFTPGLVADAQGNPAGGLLFLRGVGSGSGSPAIDQSVSLVLDDFQVGSLAIQTTALIDMQSVQVYKGPQALFFGKNSPGGVLAVKSADPGQEFEGQVKAGYNFGDKERYVQGTLSSPITDTLGGRIVARYGKNDGYFKVNSGNFTDVFDGRTPASESFFARGTLLYTPDDNWTVRAKATYTDVNGDTDGRANIQRIHCPLGDFQNPEPGFPLFDCVADREQQITPYEQETIDVFTASGISVDPTGILTNEQFLATLSIAYDAGDTFSVTSVTGYYDFSLLQAAPSSFSTARGLVASSQGLDFSQFTQELRFASNFNGPFNFVTGLFFEQKHHDSRTVVPLNLLLSPLQFDFWALGAESIFEQDTTAMSAFGEAIIDVSDNLELSAGGRYSYEQKEFLGVLNYLDPVAKRDWHDFSPQVTLSYKPSNDWLVFGSYRQGFKSGGFDGAFGFAPANIRSFEPETVEGFELGAKGTLVDGALQVSLAAFAYKYDDMQLSSFDAATVSITTINAAKADVNGVEFDFVWNTGVEGLQVRGAAAYLDSTFKEYAAPCYNGQSIALGCDGDFSATANGGLGGFTTRDASGERLQLAAEFVGTLGVSYQQDLGGMLLGLSFDGTYNSGYITGATRALETNQDEHVMLNGSITLSDIDENFSLSLVGRNLTNEFTITNGGSSPFTGGPTGVAVTSPADSIAYVRPGRTIALEATFNF